MRIVKIFFERNLSKEEAKELVFRIKKNKCVIATEVPHDLCRDLAVHMEDVSNKEIEFLILKADKEGIISHLGLG